LEETESLLKAKSNSVSTSTETSTTISLQKLNKSRDSIALAKNHSNGHSNFSRPSIGGYGIDDFTNVTGFSHYISTVDHRRLNSDNDDLMELDDDDNDNGFPLIEECKDKSNISRTMPLQLQEPPHLSLRDDTTKITSDANDTTKFFDDTYRQILKKTDPNIALATVGCQNNSIFPTPNDRVSFFNSIFELYLQREFNQSLFNTSFSLKLKILF
jgi:hypothetical protein